VSICIAGGDEYCLGFGVSPGVSAGVSPPGQAASGNIAEISIMLAIRVSFLSFMGAFSPWCDSFLYTG